MNKRIRRPQARDEPTTLGVVGNKRIHKVNKIYLLPLLMAILFTFGFMISFADGYVLTNTLVNNGEKYTVVTNDVLSCTFEDSTTVMYYITINEKTDYPSGFLCISPPKEGLSSQQIYYVEQPFEQNKIYPENTYHVIMQRSLFSSKWLTYESYTTYANVFQHYAITATPQSSGNAYDIVTPFTISQYSTKGENNEMSVIEVVLAVFSAIGDWFVEIIPSMLAIFYNSETGLTVLGVLAVASLAIAVILLVLAWIVDFFKFRR